MQHLFRIMINVAYGEYKIHTYKHVIKKETNKTFIVYLNENINYGVEKRINKNSIKVIKECIWDNKTTGIHFEIWVYEQDIEEAKSMLVDAVKRTIQGFRDNLDELEELLKQTPETK